MGKPSKSFCGLEASNLSCKIIPKIQKDNGGILTNQTYNIKEVKHFLFQTSKSI